MIPPILTREQVAQHFSVSLPLLLRYEANGLVHTVRQGDQEGYGPSELRRVWTIVSLHRDLGINLAGVEAILRLRSHVDDLHHRIRQLAHELQTIVEVPAEEGHE